MNLYFGNFAAIISTIMLAAAIAYIIFTAITNKRYSHWGRKIALLALFGLVLCCFAATRDGYHLSVQASFDETVEAGLFTIDSLQSTLCCIGGGIIAFSSLSPIFVKNQKYRKVMFFLLGAVIILKAIVIELSRLGVIA